ncbi:MAG: hypothetical protein QOG80_877 [Pseudonocardiales bacterium]|jgi:hypothetical protein|nr:hypothetical protein [Pseudonocardiales bacterium]
MRWDALFSDLAARTEALQRAELSFELVERARIEAGALLLRDRLAAADGQHVRIRCRAGVSLTGRLAHVGVDWALIDDGGGREAIVPIGAVIAVSGLGRHARSAAPARSVAERLGLRHALRGVARDRSPVRVNLIDGDAVAGTVDRVGSDFIELAVHAVGEVRRRSEVLDVLVVSHAALVAVRRDA